MSEAVPELPHTGVHRDLTSIYLAKTDGQKTGVYRTGVHNFWRSMVLAYTNKITTHAFGGRTRENQGTQTRTVGCNNVTNKDSKLTVPKTVGANRVTGGTRCPFC